VDSLVRVPLDNIKVANTLYFKYNNTVNTVLLLDSLKDKQIIHMNMMLSLCKRQGNINQEIISYQSNQIHAYKEIIIKHKIRNRLTISLAIIPVTYIIIKAL
jgi:hypothetical protein